MDKASGRSATLTVTYYPAAGAMRINSTLYYTLKDHLGSASVVTDASGNILGENRYYPYGETRLTTGTIFTDKLFTGQREMAGLGIYHYNARFYSPKLGRFLSPDTIVPGAANPQAYNRYSYVLNNPLKYTDPSGHSQCQTQEDCDDMGTTPMGTGNPHNGGGGNNGNPHDDDNDIDPNPNSLVLPEVGTPPSSTGTPTSTPCFSVVMADCYPTATGTPYPSVTPTPGCNGAITDCIITTSTPMFSNGIGTLVVAPVSNGLNNCLAAPDPTGGCGQSVDNAFLLYPGYPQGAGQKVDALIGSVHLANQAAQSLPQATIQITPYNSTYVILVILILIPGIPPF